MLDLIKTLDPANGLARGWQIFPPDSGLPLWSLAVDIGGLAARGQAVDEYPLHTVGAFGVSRADTMTRAAGEAVERYALFPARLGPAEVTATAVELGSAALDFAGCALGDPAARDRRMRWYAGRRLDSSLSVWVPAALVDYPVHDLSFDPTPSGAAAGPTLDFAVRGGLIEVIERDAVGVAWAAERELGEFDVEQEIAAARPTADWRHLTRLYRAALGQGLRPRLLRVPTLPGFHGVLAAVLDGDALAAVGAKAHENLGRALLVALQESLQIREALTRLRDDWGGVADAPDVVHDDMDRARLWLTEAATTELQRRLRDVPPVRPGAASQPPLALDELVAAVAADGGNPVAVDLTARLPEAHRAMGWHAAKVIVAGYQSLRMDERHQFTWQRARLAAAGAAVPGSFPHPLI
ncbi:YcaO-like family protein [Amycolatopsis azurea]|uniref:YcaO-like family protein n=1 Tax=Amycolatopsis azurea TaxID=36819 RepID=UPI00381C4C92